MNLELHDEEVGNSLTASITDLDYGYQAEQWVRDTCEDPDAASVVKWVLFDDAGILCVWERPPESSEVPVVTQRAARFTGTWEAGPDEIVIPPGYDEYPPCPTCMDGGRVGLSSVDCDYYCYECCDTFS